MSKKRKTGNSQLNLFDAEHQIITTSKVKEKTSDTVTAKVVYFMNHKSSPTQKELQKFFALSDHLLLK